MDNRHGDAAMIDPADKKTASLPLEQPKRGRGRPTTGAALTPAQKQKAYRERQKQLLAEAQNLEAVSRVQEGLNADAESQIRLVSKLLDQERENSERLANKVLELERQLKELKKSNVTGKEEKAVKGWDLEYWAAGKWNTLGMPSSTKKKAVERVERFNKSDSEKGLWRLKVKNGAASSL